VIEFGDFSTSAAQVFFCSLFRIVLILVAQNFVQNLNEFLTFSLNSNTKVSGTENFPIFALKIQRNQPSDLRA
jgi:hypothetical protein